MSYVFNLAQLFTVSTAASFLQRGLQIATALNLPVTTWRDGDPTLTTMHFLAEMLGTREEVAAEYIRAGFLDSARGAWLRVVAWEVYEVEAEDAKPATNNLIINNNGGGYYQFDAGDLTFRSSVTGKTYHSTTAATFSPGQQGVGVTWEADEPGSDSSVGEDEIDELVTAFEGLELASSEAGYGSDAESETSIRQRCRESLGPTSPAGPREAYTSIATSSKRTGTNEVTRARAVGNTGNGNVTITVAGSAGAVTAGALTKVRSALVQWAAHIGATPTVNNATTVPVTFTITIQAKTSLTETQAIVRAEVTKALAQLLKDTPIGGFDGKLSRALIISTVRDVYKEHITNVILTAPAVDVTIPVGSVPIVSGIPTVAVEFIS